MRYFFAALLSLIAYSTSFAQIKSAVAAEELIANSIDQQQFNASTLLWYNHPAAKWDEALPVGNGRLGGMVFGNPAEERIQLNESTYWTGGPYSSVVPGSNKYLPEVQRLIFAGKMNDANKLFGRHLMGYPVEQQKYQSLANLMLFFKDNKDVSDYKRWLNLETGITSLQYTSNGITYRRDVFSSFPDQNIVVRITASKPGSISFTTNLRGVRNQTHSDYGTDYFRMNGLGKNGLKLTGGSADYLGIKGRLKYEAQLKAVPEGGSIKVAGDQLMIDKADAVTLYFTAATNFVNYKDVSANQHKRLLAYLKQIEGKSYQNIRNAHLADHQRLFNRVSISLPITKSAFLPTDERMKNNVSAPDPQLAALTYQFGRYVLIASSRPGGQAANLQGIWNDDMNPAWDSKYTTNINLQMNYWPVESANLSECTQPLIQFMKTITDEGAKVAKEHYNARGWVLHQNTDQWMVAAPMDGPTWGTFTTGGAWLCTELWEHYLYTRDKKYLAEIYPVIKGSVQFYMDFLVKHPNGKWLVTNPSTSPENFPASEGNGPYFDETTGSMLPGTTICAGSSIDMQILTDLFGDYMQAAKVLGVDKEMGIKAAGMRKRFPPPQIGKDGALQEWTEDWRQLEKEHRHSSHMYGLYPGNVISYKNTPGFVEATKAVLNQRGDGAMGWSRAWKAALWARLKDGNRANKIIKGYLSEQACIQLFARCGKPMQVDGTMGMTAAISEMLVQSNEGVIKLLPALPDEWNEGEVKGLCTRGAFELSMKWKDGKVTEAGILSKSGEICRVNAGVRIEVFSKGKEVKAEILKDGSVVFGTVKWERYEIRVI
ncbi:MAG TPA: glycoside hydrolase family 95 protein [Mucilaginibacter sp.]|nr:glycoside hydrolase family 95 protein [Mucilaginibacter sp.]